MVASLSRRALLRGRVKAPIDVRPPHAIAEVIFRQNCDGCGDCLSACPKQILVKDEWGRPGLSFEKTGCTFCGECTRACKSEALNEEAARPWRWSAQINDNCLNDRAVSCRLCEDYCEPRAIRFKPALGGRYQLTLSASDCTGCGACVAPCPGNAISISILDEPSESVETNA